jgi:hypothetical protein
MQPMYYIGLDVQKKEISYCVKDGSGQVYKEGEVPATLCRTGSMGIWHSRQPAAYAGTDFIVARNGRIASVYLFFDNLP